MKVDVSMDPEDKFHVSSWWAKTPDGALDGFRQQLQAAAAIWPELADVKIEKRYRSNSKAESGTTGGHARAAALSPERRSEIASEAAKARWGTTQEA